MRRERSTSIAILLGAFASAAAALIAVDRWLIGNKRSKSPSDDLLVDEAGRESFPASDPPSWTLGAERTR